MARSALIVATNQYEDSKLRQLRAPADDATALARVLSDPDIGDFDVITCINPKEHELRRTVSTFFADRTADDVLLLHLGCHGLKDDDGQLYFAATDTAFDHLDATALAADFVNRRMNDSRSKRIILLLDCCYSGAFVKGMTARAGDSVEVKERFEGTGKVVLTASSAMEYSFEGDHRHGSGQQSVFTSALVRGLESGEADRDQDNWISVDELYEYVFDRVRAETPNQTPRKFGYVEGDLIVARSSYVRPVEDRALPEELAVLEGSALSTIREGLVGELRLISARPQYMAAARAALERLTEDDSRRVSAAARAALETLPASAPAAPVPLDVKLPPKRATAEQGMGSPAVGDAGAGARKTSRRPTATARLRLQEREIGQAEILGLAAALTFVAAAVVVLTWMKIDDLVGELLGSALLPVAVTAVLVFAGRSRLTWRPALLLASAVGTGSWLVLRDFDTSSDPARMTLWALDGAVTAVASLAATLAPRTMVLGVLIGTLAGGVCYLVLDLLAGFTDDLYVTGDLLFVTMYWGLAQAIIGAAIAVAVVLAPRVTTRG